MKLLVQKFERVFETIKKGLIWSQLTFIFKANDWLILDYTQKIKFVIYSIFDISCDLV